MAATLVGFSTPALSMEFTQERGDRLYAVTVGAKARCFYKTNKLKTQTETHNYVVSMLKEKNLWHLRDWLMTKNADHAIRITESYFNRDCVMSIKIRELANSIFSFIK